MVKGPIPHNFLTEVSLPTTKPRSPIISKFIELLCDINLTFDDVDEKMMAEFPKLREEGWSLGSSRDKVKRYPILARTAAEARMLLWREVGLSKRDVFNVYAEATRAEKVALDGSRTEDHDIRIKGADRAATLMGENVNPAGAKTNITVSGADAKILIQTSDGKAVPFPMREESNEQGRME